MKLEGQIAFVTGGGRGLGPAICKGLATEGARVVVGFRRREKDAAEVVATIRDAGGTAEAVAVDVRESSSVDAVIRGIVRTHERLDVLVTSAGVNRDGFLALMDDEAWDDVLRTNLGGTMRGARAALRPMIQQKSGSIVTVSSVAGPRASAGQTNYAASKGAVLALTRSLAAEVARHSIRVNAVVPGVFTVGMATRTPADRRKAVLDHVPLGRAGEPEELAKAIAFLASADASYITGQSLVVDGGLSS
jgi:3-oxoacyl-[acyl-carrier protein] reductase